MRRVEEGEERRRAAVLQDKMLIAVADFGFFLQGELGEGGVGEKIKVAPLGNPFCGNCWHCFGLGNALAPFSRGVSDTRPKQISTHTEFGRSAFS